MMYPESALVSRERFAGDTEVSVRTVVNWERSGVIPKPIRIGGRTVRYRGADLNAALERLRGDGASSPAMRPAATSTAPALIDEPPRSRPSTGFMARPRTPPVRRAPGAGHASSSKRQAPSCRQTRSAPGSSPTALSSAAPSVPIQEWSMLAAVEAMPCLMTDGSARPTGPAQAGKRAASTASARRVSAGRAPGGVGTDTSSPRAA